MKYLSTYESWAQTFKICRYEDDYFNLWIHQNNQSHKISMEKSELLQLAEFIQDFVNEEINE